MSGVEIRVRSNSTQARQDLGKLQKSVGNIEQSTKRLQSAFNKIAIGGAAFLSLASFTKGITRASDSITNMENKIALVTGRGRELNSTMQSLARVSSQTRVSFSTTAETFNRFGLALRGSGTSAKELLDVTRTINQAVTISGASSESARAAIVQFGQGLASGQLRGQELNSVLEQTPRIARAIADGIGIPFGQLRDAAAEGKLTTEAVLKAIQKAAPEIAQEFTLIEKTVDSVSNALRFQLLSALNLISKNTGWSNAVITGIESITKGLKYFTDNAEVTFRLYKLRAAIFISDIKKTFEPLTNIFTVKFDPAAAAENLKTNFNNFLEQAKGIITFEGFYDKNTKQFDFSSFFGQFELPPKFEENFTKVSTALKTFVENIKELYSALFDKKPTQSQSLLVPISLNAKEIENDEGILDKFLNGLTKFSGSVISLILSLRDTVTPLFNSIGEAITNVSSSIAATVDGLGGYEPILKKSTTAFKGYYDEITKILDLNAKAASSKDFIKGLIPEANTDLSRQINDQIKKIEDSVFGKEVFIEAGVSVKTPGILQNSFDFLDENKGLLAAAATGVGLAIVFPETTAAALQLAAIGAGLALVSVVQGAFSRGLPVLLTFGSYQAFMKGVADDPERQKEIEEFSKGIVDSLQEAFLGVDQEGSSKIVNNISAFLSSLGKGIISGLFEGTEFNNNFINAFAGALAIAVPLFIASGRGLGAIIGLGLHLLSNMFTKNSVAFALLEGLTLGVIASDSSKIAEQGKKFGKMFLKGLGAAFTLDFIFSGADEFIKEGQIKLGLDETAADSILSQIIRKTSIGFAKGAGIAFTSGIKNPYAVIGAGIAGSIYELFISSEIRSAFQDLGREIYAGFRGAIFGEDYTGGDPKAVADSVEAQEATKSTIRLKQGELGVAEKELTRYQNLFETAEQRLQRLVDIESELKQNPIGNEGLLTANKIQQERVRADILRNGMLVSNTAADIKRLSDAIGTLQSTIKPENLDISLPPQMNKQNPFYGYYKDFYKSSGGIITGAGGPKDDKIPHMLSNGEYVVQASAVKKFGPSFMDALNKGQMPQFKSGGGLAGSLPEITGGLSGGLSDSSLLALDKFDSFVKANDLQNTSLTQFFENNGLPSDQIPNVLEGMGLSHLADAPLGNPTTAIDIIDTTGIKTLSDVENYSRMTGVMESLKWAIDKPEEIFPKLGELLEHVGISVPEFPETAIEWPQFAWDSTKLIAQAGYKGLTYLAHQTQQRGTPIIKNMYHSRVKKDNLEPWINENVKEPFGLIDWDFELDKAIANGANEAILGAVYGGAFGSIKTYADLPIKFGKGVNRMGKGAWDLATGIGTFSPKKSAKGLGGLFGPMVGATRELYSLINRRRLFDQFMNTFKYGGIGATGFFFKGMLDHYIGNGLFNPTKIDKNLLPPHMQGEDLPPRMGPFDQRSAFERIKDKLSLRATPDGGGFDKSKPILDSLPFNDESIEQVSGYKRSAFQKQLDVYKNKIADRFENDEGGFFYDFGVSNPWSSMLTIGEGVGYPDDFGIPIPLMEMHTKKLEDTNSLYDFFTSYNIGLHETKHALDFLGMSIKNPGHWDKSGSTYEPGFYKGQLYSYYTDMMAMIDNKGDVLSGETRANLFAKDLSIAPPDVLNDSISKSHGSYILALHKTLDDDLMNKAVSIFGVDNYEDFIEKVINSKRQLTKEMPKNSVGRAIETGADAVNSMLFKNNSFIFDYFDKKNRIKKFATGGYVTGEGGPTDDKIPAMLSNKEFVVNAKQTSKFRPILEAINSGMVAGFAGGNPSGRASIGGVVTRQANTVDTPLQSVKATKAVQQAVKEIDNQLYRFRLTLAEAELALKTNTDQKVLEQAQDLKMFVLHERIIPLQAERNNLINQETTITEKSNEVKKKANALSAKELASGATFAEGIKQDFANGFRTALNTGDFMEIDLIDSFTTNWLNSFSQGFTDSLFGTMEKDESGEYTSTGMMGQLQQLGGGASKFGGKASPMAKEGEELTSPLFGEGGLLGGMINSIKTGISKITSGTGEGGGLGNIISSIGPFFSGLSENLSSSISSLLGGMGGSGGSGGAGGGWMSLISTGLSLFGLNNGGIVPSTPYSKAGVDSVPAMLTPGELVVPANKVKAYQDNTSKQQNVVNLSISGDVSRQTRQEIIKMLPTISAGVNATNKENNYKGR